MYVWVCEFERGWICIIQYNYILCIYTRRTSGIEKNEDVLLFFSLIFFLNSSQTKIAVKKYASVNLTKSETFIFFMFYFPLFHEMTIEQWVNVDNKRFLIYEKKWLCRKRIWTTIVYLFPTSKPWLIFDIGFPQPSNWHESEF